MTASWTPEGIRQLRMTLSLSQEKFAELVDCDVTTVKTWENGLSKPSGRYISRLITLASEWVVGREDL